MNPLALIIAGLITGLVYVVRELKSVKQRLDKLEKRVQELEPKPRQGFLVG